MKVRELGAGVLAIVAMVCVAFACGQTADVDEPRVIGDAGVDRNEAASLFDGTAKGDGGACDPNVKCSADLHHVIDCYGVVRETCPLDKGCYDGKCVPACEAAERTDSTYGCDYYSIDPAEFNEHTGSCFAAFIVNTWNSEIEIEIEFNGKTLPISDFARLPLAHGPSVDYVPLPNGKLPPGDVAILFLAHYNNVNAKLCPPGITPAISDKNIKIFGTGVTHAFHITTDRPVSGYDIYPYGGGEAAITSATLLIPASAWGTEYIAQSAFTPAPNSPPIMQPFVTLVAKDDGTHVSIKPTVDVVGNIDAGISPIPAGTGGTYIMNKGDAIQISQSTELTGTPIVSDKPIGVWGGHNCITIEQPSCDSAHQQLAKLSALGSEYIAVRHRDRLWYVAENPPWRMVGAADGTLLTYIPTRPTGAPLTLDRGQIAAFDTPDPFVVRSQDETHPFYMSAHMTGGSKYAGHGDAEWVSLIPPSQYLGRYVLFTDPTYPETSLVVVRKRLAADFIDITLDCTGPITGWLQIDPSDMYEYARVDLMAGNFESQNGCYNGVHSISSTQPFGITVWGWGFGDTASASYAYPGGAGVHDVNTVSPAVIR